MQLYFHDPIIDNQTIVLDTNTSKHLVQVLRLQESDKVLMTNGQGLVATATILVADKRNTQVRFSELRHHQKTLPRLTIAVSFTKNKSRNEWMLEKLVEIGVHSVLPILTQRTEKEKFNIERSNTILQAAMLQSKQYFMPQIAEPIALNKVDWNSYEQKMVAHCEEQTTKQLLYSILEERKDTILFIGPEGDFTPMEIDYLLSQGCLPISLGTNRLRTETAAIYAATIFNAKNEK